ncbi:TPA: hypothetical protein ACHSTH_004010 [Pseudomonas aeruginosa]
MIKNDSQGPSCTCPSGDGSLVHPCPAHPAVEQADVAAKLTFINGRPAMCGCQVEYSDGGGEYSDVIYVTLCAKHSGSAILDLVATNRIALTPEYEGQWHADLYLDREIPLAKVEGATPAEAVLALMSAERIDPEQESVEQAGGDERAAFERAFTVQEGIYFDDKRGEYRSMNLRAIEATDAQDLNLRLQGWQARAALAQPSPALARGEHAEGEQGEREAKPGLFCRACGGRLAVRGVCSIYCPTCEARAALSQEPAALLYRKSDKGDRAWSVTCDPHYMDFFRKADGYESKLLFDAALARVAELERQEPVVRAYGVLPPFAEKVLAKLRRFYDCAEDFESGGVDIGRHWLDLLTQLGLLNRVQRSPALWEISQQGEDLLEAPVAQAQHSVPEEFIGRLSEFLAQRGATGKALLRELRAMLAAEPTSSASPSCKWTESSGIWETGCGQTWGFVEDGPAENGALFCHHCGGRLVLIKSDDHEDDGEPCPDCMENAPASGCEA